MRIYLSAAILLGLLAGCSADQGSSTSKATASASSALQQGATSRFAARSAMKGFASLPDRGELLAYNQTRDVKHSGAYTAYPVALSEAHALDAMRTGEMVVKAPNGELIRLKYERHIEHPDGNWTWIGRNADGADAVLTFGEKAVFGTIPQGVADTLRLTMRAGQSFLVATDRSKLAGLDGSVRRSGTDQLIPPRLAASGSRPTTTASSVQAESMGAQAPAAAVPAYVDVLLGYTNGFATQLGGQSQAVTRLVNMTDTTNQAYVNSGVTMRVRLVGTLQVTYPDNTDNGDALEKLTGYKAGTGGGSITPDPAFSALRAKRDEVGADLVSLVRAFRTPENNGCGIAWLIGGGGYAIETADAPFGYSVVSDGTDRDEGDGKTYFCREETLAHELGHNMGQAHNTEDASSGGTHSYSYGYRQSASDGFYTVMAYPKPSASQFSIRYFANPSVLYNGAATGVANQSDNVRSMNISMPLVAGFRAEVATFADVPSSYWAFTYVQRLYQSGVTSGCSASPLLYCPSNLVTRDQIAVFLLRAKYGANYTPPAATGMFQDVPTSYWAASWIEQAVRDQFVIACSTSPMKYCPAGNVARAEMAIFLLRAKYGPYYLPPAATGIFQDLPASNYFASWAEKLAADQVTLGCATSPLRFCPNDPVPRDQMAAFLVRNFGL